MKELIKDMFVYANSSSVTILCCVIFIIIAFVILVFLRDFSLFSNVIWAMILVAIFIIGNERSNVFEVYKTIQHAEVAVLVGRVEVTEVDAPFKRDQKVTVHTTIGATKMLINPIETFEFDSKTVDYQIEYYPTINKIKAIKRLQ